MKLSKFKTIEGSNGFANSKTTNNFNSKLKSAKKSYKKLTIEQNSKLQTDKHKEYSAEDLIGGIMHISPEVDSPVKGEVAIWRAVITQALMDSGSNSKKPEMVHDRAQAIAWLAGTTRDFFDVCAMADLEPSYVRNKAKQALERGCVWRDDSKSREITKNIQKAKML